ncbi:hypothetical protein C8R44DRAFT_764397 [Mycena epipterygia]|nr:hypothetical protein C8R44DRAFT_764397 [Mycena epipterygia]
MSAQYPPPFRVTLTPHDSSELRVHVDSADSVPPPPYGAAPVALPTRHTAEPHRSSLFHPSHWFARDLRDDSEKINNLIVEYSTLPICEFLGHACAHLLKADKALLKLSKAHLHAISDSYTRYNNQELTVAGRRALLCTLTRIQPKQHNDFMSAGLRFTGANTSADTQMIAIHAIADLPPDQRKDATFLASKLHPTDVRARTDALPAMLQLSRSDESFVRSAHEVCAGCSDVTLPLQVVHLLRASHKVELRNYDGDHRVHYQPARRPEMDALAELWGHVQDGEIRIALLIAFASVPADERVMFAHSCQSLHSLVGYHKLVKLMAVMPAAQRYERAQALALPYDDPARIAALRVQWPH